MNLRCVTLTGADHFINPHDLLDISLQFPFVEWGILYHAQRQGDGSRYPKIQWIKDLIKTINDTLTGKAGRPCPQPPQFALHLCGVEANETFMKMNGLPALFDVEPHHMTIAFKRVQMNVNLRNGPFEVKHITQALLNNQIQHEVITQHNKSNQPLALLDSENYPNHTLLFDASGGRGVTSNAWSKPIPNISECGYAGGLGPDNLLENLNKIEQVCHQPYWVDMESSLRENDRFSLQKCREVLQIAKEFMERNGK